MALRGAGAKLSGSHDESPGLNARGGEPHFPPEVLMCRHSGVIVPSVSELEMRKAAFAALELVAYLSSISNLAS